MRKLCAIVFMAISICNLACRLPDQAADGDVVSSLHFTPSAFDSFKRNTELKYSLKDASTLNIYIVKKDTTQKELLVKTLVEDLADTKGSHSVTWIGDTDQHYFAPIGIYFGVVQIQDHRFETIVQVFHY